MPVYKSKTVKNKPYYIKTKNNKTIRGFRTKSDAQRYLERLEILEEGNSPVLMKMSSLGREYLLFCEQENSYGTYAKYKSIVQDIIIPNIEDKIVINVNEIDCKKFRDYISGLDYSSKYKNYILNTYKRMFLYAERYFSLGKNPSKCIQKIKTTYEESKKEHEKQYRVWDENDFERFLKCIELLKYKAIFSILFFTGMRLGECLALTWKDYDGEKIIINKNLTRKTRNKGYEIKSPKTLSSIREVTLNRFLINLLDEYKKEEMSIAGFDENWFIFGRLKPFSETQLTRIKDKGVEDSGVKKITIHEFRHSHASNLINNDVPIIAISKRLGHKDITTTMEIYSHLMEKSSDVLMEKLEESSQNLLNSN